MNTTYDEDQATNVYITKSQLVTYKFANSSTFVQSSIHLPNKTCPYGYIREEEQAIKVIKGYILQNKSNKSVFAKEVNVF